MIGSEERSRWGTSTATASTTWRPTTSRGRASARRARCTSSTAAPPDLSGTTDQLWYDFDPDLLLLDREAGDQFGAALATGRFNSDSYDDLAIGIPNEDIGAAADAGVVLVMYGSSTGLQIDSPPLPPRRFQLGAGGIGGGPADITDHFGAALAVGNFNGQGPDDLAIGIPGKAVGGQSQAGSVLVVYGGASGLTSTGHRIFDQDSTGGGTMLDVAEALDQFGAALVAGNFNDSLADDLAIGAPGEEVDADCSGSDCGAVQILYGSLSEGLWLANNQRWHEENMDTGGVDENLDRFGCVLAAGDVSGDGVDDLVIGVPDEDLPGITDAGSISILLGVPTTGLGTFGSAIYDQSDFNDGESPASSDRFGAALALAELVDTPLLEALDLAIGTPGEDVWNGFQDIANAGSVTVVGGGLVLATGTARLWAQGFGGSAGELEVDQAYGASLVVGDFSSDGHLDLAIGAPGFDLPGVANVGTVYVLHGALFADGFEVGDASGWGAVEP